MGPLEMQLLRALAIDLVRQCAEQQARDGSAAPTDADWYRRWFNAQYELWLHTPRAELDGQAPITVIEEERRRLGAHALGLSSEPRTIELYTDLPQLDPWPEAPAEGSVSGLAHESAVTPTPYLTGDIADVGRDGGPPLSAAEHERWQDFCDQHLAGWLESLPG